MNMTEVDFLARVSIFSLVSKRDLSRIAKHTKRLVFGQGDVIIREGDRDGRLFIIVSGEVEVVKGHGTANRRRLQIMGPYSYFGEMALIDDMVRSASVVAKKNTEILSLGQLNLRKTLEKYPSMATELLQMLSRRVRAVEESLVKVLGGLLPICASCKKIRNEAGKWINIEEYISEHSEAEFSHGICPDCSELLYPELHHTS